MEKWKLCQICGTPIPYLRADKKYCDQCAKDRAREMARQSKMRKRHAQPKYCNCCGARLSESERRFCNHCRTITKEQRKEKRQSIQAQKEKQKIPTYTVDQIASLSRKYRSPYNTYGKLQSYISMCGKLPPESYLR